MPVTILLLEMTYYIFLNMWGWLSEQYPSKRAREISYVIDALLHHSEYGSFSLHRLMVVVIVVVVVVVVCGHSVVWWWWCVIMW